MKRLQPGKWISHKFQQDQAVQAYQLLDNSPELALQVVLEYGNTK